VPAGYFGTRLIATADGSGAEGFVPFSVATACALDGDLALAGACVPVPAADVDRQLLGGAPPPTARYRVEAVGGFPAAPFQLE
jgi:hypothetical protein